MVSATSFIFSENSVLLVRSEDVTIQFAGLVKKDNRSTRLIIRRNLVINPTCFHFHYKENTLGLDIRSWIVLRFYQTS